MIGSQPHVIGLFSLRFRQCRWVFLLSFLLTNLVHAPATQAQSAASAAVPSACPVEFVHFDPAGVSVRIKNVSGKKIVGLTFNAALADATEHWRWYHWNFDDTRPIRGFNWNKGIKLGASKTLSWSREDIDFEHGGGGAFVLTSALFEDGSIWEESPDGASCKYVWYNSHKKSFVRPVLLPLRQ